ncbi:MAG: histidinol-phosphatase [Epsilonproteobacteria bacterium]|nr:histidinol-phosphatase [Campylobacterota bacterium]
MRIDLHNHTYLCNHAHGEMEEYILKAIDLGIDVFGFSEHAPMKNFEDGYRLVLEKQDFYQNTVLELKEKYKNKIEILLGYEVDYIEGDYILDDILKAPVDYLIGSVHYLDKWGFDNPEFIGEYEKREIDTIWEEYFKAMQGMARSGHFDIVGHFDLMKVFNFLPKKNMKELCFEALKEIKKADMVIELNSSGLRKDVKEQYPSQEILQMAYELKIPITFGSDAHMVEQVGLYYENLINLAKKIGYKECISFKKREKIKHNF